MLRLCVGELVEIVGGNLEKTAAAYPYDPDDDDPKAVAFRREFFQRFGEEPDAYSAHAYDGMNMIIKALEKGGLNRAKIRDELAAMKTYHGVTGLKEFDAAFNNLRDAAHPE